MSSNYPNNDYSNIIKANQLVRCNVLQMVNGNNFGIRNTLAVKYVENPDFGYDLIGKEWIPFKAKKNLDIYMDILNRPFDNSNTLVNIDDLDTCLEKYRTSSIEQENLYHARYKIVDIKEDEPIKKQKKKNFILQKQIHK